MLGRIGGACRLALVSTALSTAAAAPAMADFERFDIDPRQFVVAFMAHHLEYNDVLGMFLEASGHFEYDEEAPAVRAIEITVQSSSVFTNDTARDGHLRSDDFLDAESFPTISFVGTSAEQTGPDTGIVHGDLTIIGVTLPARFEVTLNKSGGYPFGSPRPYVIGVSARGTVVRSAYGMTYAVDNRWVDDEIEIIVEFQARRAEE